MTNKILDFFFDEDEKELIEEYSNLLNVAVVSVILSVIFIIL